MTTCSIMMGGHVCKYLTLAAITLSPQQAAAQEAPAAADDARQVVVADERIPPRDAVVADLLAGTSITVLADGLRQRVSATGDPIVVFDRDEMNQVQGADIT